MNYKISSVFNADICVDPLINYNDIFMFAIGYEQRSIYIAQKILAKIEQGDLRPIVIIFDDNEMNPEKEKLITKLETLGHVPLYVKYGDHNLVLKSLLDKLDKTVKNRIFIDYTSMPRSWYCNFPRSLADIGEIIHSATFWYAKGEYKDNHDIYPNTCVQDDIEVFSGKASLRAVNERTHLFGLGFDYVRTQAILSVIDTTNYGVCIAYPSNQTEILNRVKEKNDELISAASICIELPIEDFCFMLSKLSDISNNLVSKGDVILVPDGPKPLIMACSMVPDILEKNGIVCLHVKRHNHFYEKIDLTASGEIFGFEMSEFCVWSEMRTESSEM